MLGPGTGGVGLCVCELCVWIFCVDGRSMYLYIVLGGYLVILGAHIVKSCCTLWISASTVYLFMADIANPDLFVCGCRTWICLDITRFYEEQRQPSRGSAWPACSPKR